MFLRVATNETPEERKQRLEGNRAFKEDRAAKLERTRHGGAHDDVELANIFQSLNIDFLSVPREKAFAMVPEKLEGRRVTAIGGGLAFSIQLLAFLKENFDVEFVEGNDNKRYLHFVKGEDIEMNLIKQLTERSGQPRKVVKEVYEALVKQIHSSLRDERTIRLPEIGKLTVKYMPAKPKRKGVSPFTRKEMWFKAKPETNRLKFSIFKGLKEYVAEKVAVELPKKKKDKHHKKHHSH